jgi:alpha-L-fucosidase
MTMNGTWGWKRDDDNWKSVDTLVHNLVDIVSKGGNYLLNVGPTPEGEIPAPSVERLRAVGRWMKVNGEAIYGTSASPFRSLPFGRATWKKTADGAALYLHVFNWPADGHLVVPGLKSKVRSAFLLADPKRAPLETEATTEGLALTVPERAPDAISSTIELVLNEAPQVETLPLLQGLDGSLELPAGYATTHGSKLRYDSERHHNGLGSWTNPEDWAEWEVRVSRPGKYAVVADVAAAHPASFEVLIGDQKLRATAAASGDTKYQKLTLGEVKLPAARTLKVSVRPVKDGWTPVTLRAIKLGPQP